MSERHKSESRTDASRYTVSRLGNEQAYVNSLMFIKSQTCIRYRAIKESPAGFWNVSTYWHQSRAKCNIQVGQAGHFHKSFIWTPFAKVKLRELIFFSPLSVFVPSSKVNEMGINVSLLRQIFWIEQRNHSLWQVSVRRSVCRANTSCISMTILRGEITVSMWSGPKPWQ